MNWSLLDPYVELVDGLYVRLCGVGSYDGGNSGENVGYALFAALAFYIGAVILWLVCLVYDVNKNRNKT